MVIAIKRLFEWLVLVVVFLMFTLIMYKVTIKFAVFLEPNKYREPTGSSLKVTEMITEPISQPLESKKDYFDRLKVFYWLGE